MREMLAQRLGSLRGQIASDPRLRLAIWAVISLVLINLMLSLGERRVLISGQIQSASDQYHRIEAVLREADWEVREREARAHLTMVEQTYWSSESIGLARAEFQSWVERQSQVATFDIASFSLQPAVELEEMPGWYRLAATVEGPRDPAALARFLGQLEGGQRQIDVNGVMISDRSVRSRVDFNAIFHINDR